MCSNNTTTNKTVKIYAPFRLETGQRKVLAGGNLLSIATPSGRSYAQRKVIPMRRIPWQESAPGHFVF